jgi:LPS-assembly protein
VNFHLKALLVAAAVMLGTAAHGQAPELSADQPIAYTADNGILIATGNAIYQDENTRVEADEIRYNRVQNRIEASGNVRVTRDGMRLLTHHLLYDTLGKTVTAGKFRAGRPPLFVEGDSFTGTLEEIDFSKVSVFFREPVDDSPRLQMESGKWIAGESVSGSGLRLKALGGIKIPAPSFKYGFGSASADVEARLGFRNSLGAYARTKWLYPVNPSLSLGGNLDLFSRRGVLVGPTMEWSREEGNIRFSLDSGWIHDHDSDERGSDLLGDRIEQSRGFMDLGLSARTDEGDLQLQGRTTYVSDSEFYRDFRRNEYFQNYQPDSFLDFTLQKGSFLFNAFARRQFNDGYGMVERLPELRAEWLPTRLGESGLVLQASAGATRYRKISLTNLSYPVLFPGGPLGLAVDTGPLGTDFPELIENPYHNRLDGSLTLSRPFNGPAGTRIVLRAGSRYTHYRRDATGSVEAVTGDRWVGELGFDISKSLVRTFEVNRPDWNMDRLRHLSRFTLQYRWHPGGGDSPEGIPDADDYVYLAQRPVLDLADIAHTDSLREWSVARIGWENCIMAAGEDESYRDYLSFNLYQDIDFSADPGDAKFDALYAQVDFYPFPWLDLQLRQKLRTENKESEAAFLRATLHSADLWSLTLQAEYLRSGIEQYELAAHYRLTENIGVLGYWHYDAKLDTLTRQQYGFSRRFGNVWQLEMYVAFNNENGRDDDFSVGMRMIWLSF